MTKSLVFWLKIVLPTVAKLLVVGTFEGFLSSIEYGSQSLLLFCHDKQAQQENFEYEKNVEKRHAQSKVKFHLEAYQRNECSDLQPQQENLRNI